VPLKKCLEAHITRAARKKGVKGRAILCGVGAAHLPRSDGVSVSVPTVSQEDSILLKMLDEVGELASSASSSSPRRTRSI
jgi:hypothetical protein